MHEDWLVHGNTTAPGPPHQAQLIVIDADQDISVLSKTYSKLAKAIWKTVPKELQTPL